MSTANAENTIRRISELVKPGYREAVRRIKTMQDGFLDISKLDLGILPPIPEGVRVLTCSNNRLTALPNLPSTLTDLDCENNNLTNLPILPAPLKRLTCSNNHLLELPELSSTILVALFCNHNSLYYLPNLPDTLNILVCSENQISGLPTLPLNLKILNCSNTNITSLPNLPSTLRILLCNSTDIDELPELPDTLERFSADKNQFRRAFLDMYTIYKRTNDIGALRTAIREYYTGVYAPHKPNYHPNTPRERIDYYYTYISTLPENEQYTAAQYSFHGDVILNAMLRGNDTLNTYIKNIMSPNDASATFSEKQISCLFLYIIRPDLISEDYLKAIVPGVPRWRYYQINSKLTNGAKTMNRWTEEYTRNNARKNMPVSVFRNYKNRILTTYINNIYPTLESHFTDTPENLAYFRNLTYTAFKTIFYTMQGVIPRMPAALKDGEGFVVYRGVEKFYLPILDQVFITNSFTSTTVDTEMAYSFYRGDRNGGIYQFIVAPNVPCLYMETLTYVPEEYEYTFPPGIRFKYVKTYRDDGGHPIQIFMVFPPHQDEVVNTRVPETYDEYMAWVNTLEWPRQQVLYPGEGEYITKEVATQVVEFIKNNFGHFVPKGEPLQMPAAPPPQPSAPPGSPSPDNNLYVGGKRTCRKTRRRLRGGRVQTIRPVNMQIKPLEAMSSRQAFTRKKSTSSVPNRKSTRDIYVRTAPKLAMPAANQPKAAANQPKAAANRATTVHENTKESGNRWSSMPTQYKLSKLTEHEEKWMKMIETKLRQIK